MRNGVGGEADTERALGGGVTSSLTSALEYLPCDDNLMNKNIKYESRPFS